MKKEAAYLELVLESFACRSLSAQLLMCLFGALFEVGEKALVALELIVQLGEPTSQRGLRTLRLFELTESRCLVLVNRRNSKATTQR